MRHESGWARLDLAAVVGPRACVGLHYLVGDATQPEGEGPKAIVHVCNDVGGWGAGFVLALSRRWSLPEQAYRSWYSARTPAFGLGLVQWVSVAPSLWVVNMIAQTGLRATADGPPIRYAALEEALRRVVTEATSLGASVHMPRIGCGLAGGTWSRVAAIVERTLVAAGVEAYVYDLP